MEFKQAPFLIILSHNVYMHMTDGWQTLFRYLLGSDIRLTNYLDRDLGRDEHGMEEGFVFARLFGNKSVNALFRNVLDLDSLFSRYIAQI